LTRDLQFQEPCQLHYMGLHIRNVVVNTRVQKFHRLMHVWLCTHRYMCTHAWVCAWVSKWERLMTNRCLPYQQDLTNARTAQWTNTYIGIQNQPRNLPIMHMWKREVNCTVTSSNRGLSKYVACSQSSLTLIHCDLKGR